MPYLGSSCTSFELPDPEDEDTVIPQNLISYLPSSTTTHLIGLEMYALFEAHYCRPLLCIVKYTFYRITAPLLPFEIMWCFFFHICSLSELNIRPL
jgi:hypothetical protein